MARYSNSNFLTFLSIWATKINWFHGYQIYVFLKKSLSINLKIHQNNRNHFNHRIFPDALCPILTSRWPPLGSSFERLLSFYESQRGHQGKSSKLSSRSPTGCRPPPFVIHIKRRKKEIKIPGKHPFVASTKHSACANEKHVKLKTLDLSAVLLLSFFIKVIGEKSNKYRTT